MNNTVADRPRLLIPILAGLSAAIAILGYKGAFDNMGDTIENIVNAISGSGLSEAECIYVMDSRMINIQKINAWEDYKQFVTDPNDLKKIDEIIQGIREEIAEQDKIIAECQQKFPHLKPN